RTIEGKAADDPVFGLWKRLQKLPSSDFSEEAAKVIESAQDSNPMLRQALAAASPTSMKDVARVYGTVLEDVYGRWQEVEKVDPGDEGFESAELETLRQVLYADDAPVRMVTNNQMTKLYIGDEKKQLKEIYITYEKKLVRWIETAVPQAMAMIDRPQPKNSHIQKRGDPTRPGKQVPRRFLKILSHVDGGQPFSEGSGRLELARAIAHPDNPLTPRVMVNRVWGWHFGRAIVETPSNFGTRGQPPSHPQLLDYLAQSFIDSGWSIKSLHRLIMTSATYRQASNDRTECRSIDPQNEFYWKMKRRRLDFESMRDSLLSLAGNLSSRVGGVPFEDNETPRRSLYRLIDRQSMPRLLMTFDVSVPEATLSKRSHTTVPQQALFLLNSGFVDRRSNEIVEQLDEQLPTKDVRSRITAIYQRLFQRDPTSEEYSLAKRFLDAAINDLPGVGSAGPQSESWQYGTGSYDPRTKRVTQFTPFSIFDG
ncbi:MAG: DUF1553 domain-containing protein, partial [Planctomycetales bacterium]